MFRNCLGLCMDYDVKMSLQKPGKAPLAAFGCKGDHCIPVVVIGAVALLGIALCITRWCAKKTKKK